MLSHFMDTRILLLATNDSDSFIFLSCLQEGGYKNIFIVGPRKENQKIRFFPICKKFYEFPQGVDYKNIDDRLLGFLLEVCTAENIDIIFPTGFDSQKFISYKHENLKKMARVIPAPRPETIALLNNKHSFSVFCQDHHIPHPKTFLLERLEQILDIKTRMSFPILTKPLSMSSGRGILRFEGEEDLATYLKKQTAGSFNELPLLIQEFLPGEDIDFNGFALNGVLKAWTIQKFLDIPFRNRFLRWYQFIRQDKVLAIGRKIVEASGYTGAIHIDLRYDEREDVYKTIEVNPRFWASTFYSVIDGVNFVDVAMRATLDKDFLSIQPRCSGRIWGSPHHLPYLLLRYHNRTMFYYASRHTMLQLKYMVRSFAVTCRSKSLKNFFKVR